MPAARNAGGTPALQMNHMYYYIALGDSISIDDYPGEDKGAASLLYRNLDTTNPGYRASIIPGLESCGFP